MWMSSLRQHRIIGYFASVAGVLGLALFLWPFYGHVEDVTAATALMIVVLLVALKWGTGPSIVSSLLGALYLNFFYDEPILKFSFRLAQGADLVGLVAFLLTSILVGQLSSQAQRRAETIQELYDQLRAVFDRSSQLEAIRQSERLKSALLDTVTHDLRTPLTSIKAAATTLVGIRNSGSADTATEGLLGIIVQQSDRLNHFIEEMIELAKAESDAGQGQRKWDQTPVEEIIAVALSRAEDSLRSHHVIVDCADDLKASVSPHSIAQALFSLLDNAGIYAPPATTVRVIAIKDGPENVLFAVEDAGPGIPRHLRETVFDKFVRGGNTARSGGQTAGLGLGLAIARGIIEAHGGKIWVEDRSAGESGARFVFTVPTRPKAEPMQTESKKVVLR